MTCIPDNLRVRGLESEESVIKYYKIIALPVKIISNHI